MGQYIFDKTAGWSKEFRTVGEVRGKGLMVGIELVRDKETKEKYPDMRNRIVSRAFQKGLLILGAGENSLRLAPPLMIDEQQADFAIDTLAECIREDERSH